MLQFYFYLTCNFLLWRKYWLISCFVLLTMFLLTHICYTENVRFARLKNIIGQVEWTSGRLEVHSHGSVQSKGGIEVYIVFKKLCFPFFPVRPIGELRNLLWGVRDVQEKFSRWQIKSRTLCSGILVIQVFSPLIEIVVIKFELSCW